MNTVDELVVSKFLTYLRFPTVHPNPDYYPALNWLRGLATNAGLESWVTEIIPGNPILVMRWLGSQPNLPSVLLNSHMDVVPVDEASWTHSPFAAEVDEQGNIFARGSQDMKCVGIQQLEAICRLKASGFLPLRTIYISFVPDEELGGKKGMSPFVEGQTPKDPNSPCEITFDEMNVGFCLDEGLVSPSEEYVAFFEERSPWWVEIVCTGQTGHGSTFVEDTAVEKLHRMLSKLLDLRRQEKMRMLSDFDSFGLGNVISLNVTILEGGLQVNVVPGCVKAFVDLRLPPNLDFVAFENQLLDWATESGPGVELKFIQKDMGTSGLGKMETVIDRSSPWWNALFKVVGNTGSKLHVSIFPGATDARFIRRHHNLPHVAPARKPILAINFTPIRNTPILLHGHDEFLNKEEFLSGVRLYTDLLREIAMIP